MKIKSDSFDKEFIAIGINIGLGGILFHSLINLDAGSEVIISIIINKNQYIVKKGKVVRIESGNKNIKTNENIYAIELENPLKENELYEILNS